MDEIILVISVIATSLIFAIYVVYSAYTSTHLSDIKYDLWDFTDGDPDKEYVITIADTVFDHSAETLSHRLLHRATKKECKKYAKTHKRDINTK